MPTGSHTPSSGHPHHRADTHQQSSTHRQPNAPPAARHPLGGARCNQAPTGRPKRPLAATYHRPSSHRNQTLPRPTTVQPPSKRRRPPPTGLTPAAIPITDPTPLSPLGDQIPTDSPHRRPTTGGSPTPLRRPDILSAAPLQSSTLQRRSPHLRTDTYHRPTLGSRPSPTQRPLCHSLSPFPRQPSGASPNGRQKRSPSAGRGLNHLSMTNPQRGYLFSFRMRIACSRIVVSSNVTMPPSGPGSK